MQADRHEGDWVRYADLTMAMGRRRRHLRQHLIACGAAGAIAVAAPAGPIKNIGFTGSLLTGLAAMINAGAILQAGRARRHLPALIELRRDLDGIWKARP